MALVQYCLAVHLVVQVVVFLVQQHQHPVLVDIQELVHLVAGHKGLKVQVLAIRAVHKVDIHQLGHHPEAIHQLLAVKVHLEDIQVVHKAGFHRLVLLAAIHPHLVVFHRLQVLRVHLVDIQVAHRVVFHQLALLEAVIHPHLEDFHLLPKDHLEAIQVLNKEAVFHQLVHLGHVQVVFHRLERHQLAHKDHQLASHQRPEDSQQHNNLVVVFQDNKVVFLLVLVVLPLAVLLDDSQAVHLMKDNTTKAIIPLYPVNRIKTIQFILKYQKPLSVVINNNILVIMLMLKLDVKSSIFVPIIEHMTFYAQMVQYSIKSI